MQGILAALTLPRLPRELDQEFVERVLVDSKQQARDAADLGSSIHGAIQLALADRDYANQLAPHVVSVLAWLLAQFPGVQFMSERSFVCELGYGGKVDLYARTPPIVIDFKTKGFDEATVDRVKGYDEHGVQLAAYAHGLGLSIDQVPERWNIFVSTQTPGLIVPWYWPLDGYARHLDMFRYALAYWQADKGYKPAQVAS
jgi:hypothetical protein